MHSKKRTETDSVYFLKILLFFIVGTIWLTTSSFEFIPGVRSLPIGLFIGIVFASHDHFKIDKKIEYAVLLAAAIISYAAPVGVVIQL